MKKQHIILIAVLFFGITSGFAQEQFKIQHGPYLQHLDENGVNIVFTANRTGIAWVELAPDDSTHFYLTGRPKFYSSQFGFKNIATTHSIRIDNLKPGTRYRYRVYSQEVLSHKGAEILYGTTAANSVSRNPLDFKTNTPLKENISFAMINDIHGRNEVMESLLNNLNYENTDLIFFNGDMVSNFTSEFQLYGDFMDTAVKLFAGRIPMYYVRGNHETRGNYAASFHNYFMSPSGNLYYLVRQGPVCFVVLDCGEDKPDSDIEYFGIADFDQYRDKEALWLKEIIQTKDFIEARFKIAVVHMPPFGGWHGEDEVAQKFVPLLNKAGIDLMLCGHLHKYVKQEPVSGQTSFPIIVNSNNAIVKAETNGNQLNIKIIGLKGEQIDSFSVTAKK